LKHMLENKNLENERNSFKHMYEMEIIQNEIELLKKEIKVMQMEK